MGDFTVNVRQKPMDFNRWQLGLCVRTNPLSSLVGKYWGRREVTHKSTQAEEINFALKEGQTIVAVLDETKAMCFYIGNDVIDVKDYE